MAKFTKEEADYLKKDFNPEGYFFNSGINENNEVFEFYSKIATQYSYDPITFYIEKINNNKFRLETENISSLKFYTGGGIVEAINEVINYRIYKNQFKIDSTYNDVVYLEDKELTYMSYLANLLSSFVITVLAVSTKYEKRGE